MKVTHVSSLAIPTIQLTIKFVFTTLTLRLLLIISQRFCSAHLQKSNSEFHISTEMESALRIRQDAVDMRRTFEEIDAFAQDIQNKQPPRRPIAQNEDVEGHTPIKNLEELKARGNEAFKKKHYKMAKGYYKQAHLLCSSDVKILANMALMQFKRGKFNKTEKICNIALQEIDDVKSILVKILFRRASARMKLGYLRNAHLDLQLALKFEPSNREILLLKRKIGSMIKTTALNVPKHNLQIRIV